MKLLAAPYLGLLLAWAQAMRPGEEVHARTKQHNRYPYKTSLNSTQDGHVMTAAKEANSLAQTGSGWFISAFELLFGAETFCVIICGLLLACSAGKDDDGAGEDDVNEEEAEAETAAVPTLV